MKKCTAVKIVFVMEWSRPDMALENGKVFNGPVWYLVFKIYT